MLTSLDDVAIYTDYLRGQDRHEFANFLHKVSESWLFVPGQNHYVNTVYAKGFFLRETPLSQEELTYSKILFGDQIDFVRTSSLEDDRYYCRLLTIGNKLPKNWSFAAVDRKLRSFILKSQFEGKDVFKKNWDLVYVWLALVPVGDLFE